MSDIIQLLPDSVANQIAAGEVIQRPASVIKELVENSIDAGATSVNVLVVDAGRTSIQVIDNGKGMSDTDARLAFERHATSKIRKADDLFALHTMGFRGEALASIAAVAQVELKTRTADSEVGTDISISGSKVTGQEPVACPVGSNMMVENLFYNVPARRKFLKTNATELNNVMTAYERIVLVYPDICFTLHSNGSELLNLRSGSLRQRIADVFGKRFNNDLLPVTVDTAICKITGFVGKPEAARKKGAHQYFFVNGRYMKHPYFHKAVMQAFDRMVPVGMQVHYFIYFEVPPTDIDVNIHPTKTEIKFENEQSIWQILMAAVRDSLGKFCEVPAIDFDTEGKPDIPLFVPSSDVTPPSVSYNPEYNPFAIHDEKSKKAPAGWEQMYSDNSSEEEAIQDTSYSEVAGGIFEMPLQYPEQEKSCQGNVPENQRSIIEDRLPAHYQYKGKYIMTAVKSGLMIINQHRAGIRIQYEKILRQLESCAVGSQKVLFPEVIQFSPSEVLTMNTVSDELIAAGFDLTDLGGNSYAVNGIPAGMEGMDYVALLHGMIGEVAEIGSSAVKTVRQTLALAMARSMAVSEGEVLTNMDMECLVNELFLCSNVNYTPDGDSILSILAQKDIDQLFG